MDAAWAVVTAVIATFLGSAIIPWVREAIESRSRRTESLLAARSEALVELVEAMSAQEGITDERSEESSRVRVAAIRLRMLTPEGTVLDDRLRFWVEVPLLAEIVELRDAVDALGKTFIFTAP